MRGHVTSIARAGGGLTASLAGCVLTSFLTAAPASALSATHPAWTIQKSPNTTVPSGRIESVSCSSASACTAVGTTLGTSGLNLTLALRWNGTIWQRERTPKPGGGTVPASSPTLSGVSCPSSSFCEAVGSYQVGTTGISLAESWNGSGWALQTFPVPLGSTSAVLTQVSCPSAQLCEAVGFYTAGSGEILPFAAHWNGTSWHLQRTPVPAGASITMLSALSCVSPDFCEAGGDAPGAGAFALRWNGTSWHLQTLPGTAGSRSISCVSVSFCESAGFDGGDVWNGSSWSSQPIPGPPGATSSSLSGVSCTATTFCVAVGDYSDSSGSTFSLSDTWNGTSWTAQTA